MKKLIPLLMACLSISILSSCKTEVESDWEGTKLTVAQGEWPQNIESIRLSNEKGKACALSAPGTCEANSYFKGNVTLTVIYSRLSDEEKELYYGYGILNDSPNPFKVFANGVEVENQTPQAQFSDHELNVNVESFETTFNIGEQKTVKVSFENAPTKILNKDVRLSDETGKAYIDSSELQERFSPIFVCSQETQWQSFPAVVYNGLQYFDIYSEKIQLNVTAKPNHYISKKDFKVDTNAITEIREVTSVTSQKNFGSFDIHFNSVPKKGSVIKITGGEIKPYDTGNFAGKTFDYVQSLLGGTFETTSAAIELSGTDSWTAKMTWNGKEYGGTWTINDESKIEVNLSQTDSETGACKAEIEFYDHTYNEVPGPNWVCELRSLNGTLCAFILHERQ